MLFLTTSPNSLPGGNSEREPPDPISNSEVKPLSADDSVGSPHVKVGHCQASKQNKSPAEKSGIFLWHDNYIGSVLCY